MASETPKRRGRPPNKPKDAGDQQQEQHTAQPAKRRGRPPNPNKATMMPRRSSAASAAPKRGRGRPPKAKNEGPAASVSTVKAKPTKTATKAKPRGRPRKSDTGTAKDPTRASSIVGGYAITCKAISEEWPEQGDDFGLDISESVTPGVYEGSFDFGILEGAMVLSGDKALIKMHVERVEADEDHGHSYGYEDGDEDGDEDSDEDEPTATGGKRKATGTTRGQPAKKVKKAPGPGLIFHALWRGCDTSEGQIHPEPWHATIKFTNKNYTKFTGEIDLPSVGQGVTITGKRVTDQASGDTCSWNDYSQAVYERANVDRWH